MPLEAKYPMTTSCSSKRKERWIGILPSTFIQQFIQSK
jgi:hypothetical protein